MKVFYIINESYMISCSSFIWIVLSYTWVVHHQNQEIGVTVVQSHTACKLNSNIYNQYVETYSICFQYLSILQKSSWWNSSINVWRQESKYASFMTMEEVLQTVEKYWPLAALFSVFPLKSIVSDPRFNRQLEEPDVDDLSITDLVHLENQFETALTQTRFRKVGSSTFLCASYSCLDLLHLLL